MIHRSIIRAQCALVAAVAAAGFLLITTGRAEAATITVTGTGDGIVVDGVVTLREAIASINAGANVNADVVAVGTPYGTGDLISFAIPGAGVHTIALASAFAGSPQSR